MTQPTTFLRFAVVQARTGLSRPTIYRRVAQGTFPKPVPLGNSAVVGFVEAEINQWIEQQLRAARGDQSPILATA